MVTENGQQAEIRIADRGHGIPEEAREHMFDAGMDGDTGLAEVSHIATVHGGSVSANDNPGGGTIIVVRIPLNSGDDDVVVEDAVVMDE
jgi:signal transduction histidine kinase